MKASFVLGRIFGIEIGIHFSWFFILIFLTWSLSVAYFPQSGIAPDLSSAGYWVLGAISSLALFISVLAHELGHSIVARRNGIPVKNITLFIFGGSSNITREAQSPSVELRMAATGPLVSFGLAALFYSVYIGLSASSGGFMAVMVYLAQINLILGIFNLLPGFPLDGGRVFKAIVWYFTNDEQQATRIAAGAGQVLAYLMIFGGVTLAFLIGISGLWLALIGWFLASAATASYQSSVVTEMIKGVRVRDISNNASISISPETSGEQALAMMLNHNQRSLPVIGAGRLLGLITLTDLKRHTAQEWAGIPVETIMTPIGQLTTLNPDDELARALQLLTETGYNQVPVVKDGQMTGMITRSDILNYIRLRADIK